MYFSMDVGGVVEFYPSRRIVTRLDIGDTIVMVSLGIRSSVSVPQIGVPPAVFEWPAETRHNLQLSAGIGMRFLMTRCRKWNASISKTYFTSVPKSAGKFLLFQL